MSFVINGSRRRHPVPPTTNFEDLNRNLKRVVGIELDVSTSKKLSESLDKAVVPHNEYFNTLVRIMTTRCMTQAVYFSSGNNLYDIIATLP